MEVEYRNENAEESIFQQIKIISKNKLQHINETLCNITYEYEKYENHVLQQHFNVSGSCMVYWTIDKGIISTEVKKLSR